MTEVARRAQAANSGLVLDPEKLYQALDAHRRHLVRQTGRKMSWRQVATAIGVMPSTFSRLGIRHANLHANVLIKLLAWMGNNDLTPYIREIPRPPADPTGGGDE